MVPGEVFLIAAPAEEYRFSIDLGWEVDETDAEVPILEEAPNGLKLAQVLCKLILEALHLGIPLLRLADSACRRQDIGHDLPDQRQRASRLGWGE